MKICLACSPGGHLTEIQQLKEIYKEYDYFYITAEREDTGELENVYYIKDYKRDFLGFIRNVLQSLKIFSKKKPDIIITTGAGIVIPTCIIGKLFGIEIIFIESFCRIESPSLTGKFLYPISDYFFVQWEELLEKYGKKAVYRGKVF